MNTTNTTLSTNLTKEHLTKLVDELRPKKIVLTGNEKLYNKMLNLPNASERCIQFNPLISKDKAYIVDMEMVEENIFKSCGISSKLF